MPEVEFNPLQYECNNDEISIFGQQKHYILENEPCGFRKILPT